MCEVGAYNSLCCSLDHGNELALTVLAYNSTTVSPRPKVSRLLFNTSHALPVRPNLWYAALMTGAVRYLGCQVGAIVMSHR